MAQYKQSHQVSYHTGSSVTRKRRSLAKFATNGQQARRNIRNVNHRSEDGNSEETEDEDEGELAEENEDEESDDYVEPEPEENFNNHDRLDGESAHSNSNDAENGDKSIKLNTPFWDTYDSINQLYLELSKSFTVISIFKFIFYIK